MNAQTWQRRGVVASVGFVAFLLVAGTVVSSFQWVHRPFPGFFLYDNLTVVPDFLPEWSGRKEGLRFLDRVVMVEDRPIRHPKALYDVVRSLPPGSPVRYTAERAGARFQVTVPSMKFTFHDWLLSFGIYLLTGVGFLAIGITPFYFRSPSPATTPLFFMVSAIFFWFLNTFDFVATYYVPKEVRIFAFVLTPSAGIHLGLALSKTRKDRKNWVSLGLVYTVSILLGLIYSFTFYGPFEVWHWVLRVSYGYSCLAAIVFIAILWTRLRASISDLERWRLRVVLVGATLGFFLPTLGTVLTTSLQWQIPYNLLLIPAVCFPLSVAYALLKYNLFDLDVVLKIGLTRLALTASLWVIYVSLVFASSVSVGIYEQDLLVPLSFAILVVLVFNPLLRGIEGMVDRYIYRKEYDPVQLQEEVSAMLRSLSRPQGTAQKFLKLITEQIGIETAYLFFWPEEKERFLVVASGAEQSGVKEIPVNLSPLWMEHFGIGKKGVSRDEIDSDPLLQESRGDLRQMMDTLRAELLIPVIFEANILGFLALGKKRSGREYSGDDFRLLCNLADQLALSLKNGMLFEESEKAKENYRRLYDQAQGMNRQLVEVDRLKKQFVANISHELRTPISTILGYAEVLLGPDFQGDARGILERMAVNGQEVSRLMDSLLDFSRVEAGSTTLSVQEVDLREILQAVEVMAQRLIRGRPIHFRVSVEPSLDVVETDPKKLQQILMQLLTNALKFTESGEIAIEVRLVTDQGAPHVALAVSDTGIGISKLDQEIIFEEFRQLDGSSTRKYGGTGLGLHLCRKLAQSVGGRIEVESVIGQGSTFTLVVPLRRSPLAMAGGFQP